MTEPVECLPYGVFSRPGHAPRVGVRVGGHVVDLAPALGEEVFDHPALNPFMAQGRTRWEQVRARLTAMTLAGSVPEGCVHPLADVALHLPFEVADLVDCYASEHHASNLGRILRPGTPPLQPNWRHLPVGYHGRAGTVVVSGTDVVRPSGQRCPPGQALPDHGPTRKLDVEVELGLVVGVPSALGSTIPVDEVEEHLFGVVLVNDWSARDLQAWETVPLGPFLGKSFATSVSPWVVPLAALQAARIPLPPQDPVPLAPLRGTRPLWGLDVALTLRWNGQVVSRPPYATTYWSPAQLLAHVASNGASARTGDLVASGTVSGPARHERGSLIELSWDGAEPLRVDGELRTFLADGDTVTISATAPAVFGGRLDLGAVTGTVLPAR